MTLTAAEASLHRALRAGGASVLEAAIVLAATRESGRAVELSYKTAYLHEHRDAHGRFTSGGGGGGAAAKRMKVAQARAHGTSTHEAVRSVTALERVATETQAHVIAEQHAQQAAADAVNKAQGIVDKARQEIRDEQETKENAKLRKKLIVRVGLAIGTALLAIIEAKFLHLGGDVGTATFLSLAGSEFATKLGPEIAKELIEFRKRV